MLSNTLIAGTAIQWQELPSDSGLSQKHNYRITGRVQIEFISTCFLQSFLASKEGEQRLAQLKERFEQGGQAKLPAEAQALLSTWHQEQEGELATLRAHCQGRHKQLDDILHNLNRYMEEGLIIAISCYCCFDSFMTLSSVCMRNITI